MGAIHFSLDSNLANLLRQKLQIGIFFETGTFEATTTSLMAPLFERVITVEISKPLHADAVRKLAQFPNIEAVLGSSPDVLLSKGPELEKENVLYWLDAHWCVHDKTGGSSEECPVLRELDAIGRLGKNSVILIDNARYFLAPPPAPHDFKKWPGLLEVTEALLRLSNDHKLFVVNDVFLFVPAKIEDDIVAYARDKGVDLFALSQAAIRNRESNGTSPEHNLTKGSGLQAGFNRLLLQKNNPERIFAFHASRLGISRLLDIGSHSGQFATRMRQFGFAGFIYSVEPQSKVNALLRQTSQADVGWIPLPQQAAGAETSSLSLNISENSWSSSLLVVHENHLRAEPRTRAVAQEEVPVTRAANLLHGSLMEQIDAVKIDTQGYEAQVLEGLKPYIKNIRLMLVEMSLVECYVGAPDLFSLDKVIVEEFGFKRISLEPSYYDDTTGYVQQYDGIYIKEEANAPNLSTRPIAPNFGSILTSLNGQPKRTAPNGMQIGDRWLEYCVNSWRSHSSRIVSVSESAPLHNDIHWIKTKSRPSIAEILDGVDDNQGNHTILCNADIMISDALSRGRPRLDPSAIYLASRVEVELRASDMQTLDLKSVYDMGYDLFILPPEFVQHTRKFKDYLSRFRIGEPWWDYLIPIMALAAGFPVKRLPVNDPIALHYSHPANYDQATWLRLGEEFLKTINKIDQSSTPGKLLLVKEISEIDLELGKKLNQISKLICKTIP